jgi:hypothetical protein
VSVDPLQFEYPYYTPYQYAGNKPITFIDLDGLEPGNSPSSNYVSGPDGADAAKARKNNRTSKSSSDFGKLVAHESRILEQLKAGDLGRSPMNRLDAHDLLYDVQQKLKSEFFISGNYKDGFKFDEEKWKSANQKYNSGLTGLEKADMFLNLQKAKTEAEAVLKTPYFTPFEKNTNRTNIESTKEIGNWFPVAIIVSGDVSSGYGPAASAEVGAIIFLQGKNAGEAYALSDMGVGAGWNNASINGKLAYMFWTGDVKDFGVETAAGWRTEANVGISAYLELGLSGSWGDYDEENKGRAFTVGVTFGLGATPSLGEGDVNRGKANIEKIKF